MKINDQLRFPHPVLGPFTEDFGEFSISMDILVEEVPATSALTLRCTFRCEHPQLNTSRENGLVDCFANVVCLATYFNEFFPLSNSETRIDIEPGLLRGLTRIRPICVAAEDIHVDGWEDVHPEFNSESCRIPKAGIVAVGEEFLLDVGLDKLRPMESIFRLAKKDTLEEGEIAVDIETQYIRINASPELYATITELRNLPATRDVLLNSVYLAATLEVLSLIDDDPQTLEDRWWFRIFSARCTQLGLDPETADLLDGTQLLLNRPLHRLQRLREIIE